MCKRRVSVEGESADTLGTGLCRVSLGGRQGEGQEGARLGHGERASPGGPAGAFQSDEGELGGGGHTKLGCQHAATYFLPAAGLQLWLAAHHTAGTEAGHLHWRLHGRCRLGHLGLHRRHAALHLEDLPSQRVHGLLDVLPTHHRLRLKLHVLIDGGWHGGWHDGWHDWLHDWWHDGGQHRGHDGG